MALVGGISAQGATENLITSKSAGKLKQGMTVAQTRKALSGMKFERTSDREGIALIAVKREKDTI